MCIRIVESLKRRWPGHVKRMEHTINAFILTVNMKGKDNPLNLGVDG